MSDVLKLLRALVRINSVNPDLLSHVRRTSHSGPHATSALAPAGLLLM